MQASTLFLPGMLAGIGTAAASLLLGSANVGQETLTRFFALHIYILPAFLLSLVAIHLLLVQIYGMSIPLSVVAKVKGMERFFPTFMFKDVAVWIALVAVLMILANILPSDSFLPYTLARAYDPLAPAPSGIRREWYFFFVYYPLEMLPRTLVIVGTLLLTLAYIFTPWILNWIPSLWRKAADESKFATGIAITAVIIVAILTIFGASIVAAVRGSPP